MVNVFDVLSAANSLSGGRLFNAAKKNVGKFVGKIGRAGTSLLSENARNKVNSWAEGVADWSAKVMGEDSEITKNLQNFTKEMKGEKVEWRRHDDGEEDKNGAQGMYDMNASGPYIKNLGGTNFQKYIPRKSVRGSVFKRVKINPHSKFGRSL